MENILNNKKLLILIIGLAILIFILLLSQTFYVAPPPTPNYFSRSGPNPDVVPTIAPDSFGNGGGVDISSPIIKESEQNIEILKDKLPYGDNFKSTTGLNVSVFIPKEQLSPSELGVAISGINYLSDAKDPDYNKNKTAFLEAIDRVFGWVQNKGADPHKIYFSWSDKKFNRDIIQEWLNSK